MSNIYIVNAGKEFAHSKGQLNMTLAEFALDTLKAMGHQVQLINIDQGYVPVEEVKKLLWADAVIYQQPGWWMGAPWILKKYMDDVFTAGHDSLYENDGRTRSDLSKKYGSGGLVHDKKYMISTTWNAPIEAFTDPDQFFEGVGVDGVYLPFHKANQFLGMRPLPTFICNDVMKEPNIPADLERYRAHLNTVFGA